MQLLRRIGTAEALRLARFLLLPAKRMGEELFGGERRCRPRRGLPAATPVTASLSGRTPAGRPA